MRYYFTQCRLARPPLVWAAMTRITTGWVIGLTLLTSPLHAQAFDGNYQSAICTTGVSDSRMSIRGSEIAFWESSCALTNPVDVRDMNGAVLFDLQCSGEGMTWTDRVMLMPIAEGGVMVVRAGSAIAYQRCN